ncbi:MAG: heavy metal translocating P-type ATPase [Erysipelotrichaceae bacterium]|nr:heavy metal translocating P-type ATPase [Erysipelotrichaceae bacterium]
MKQYIVTGMSCAACQARVEKAVSNLDGVSSCAVSLLTNSMSVEGNVSDREVIEAVVNAGYGASVKGAGKEKKNAIAEQEEALKDHETPVLKKRLISSVLFLLVLMYISMGHNMLNLPIPVLMHDNPLIMALVEMLLASIVMLINYKFFTSGFSSLMHGAPNMDTLVAMGSMASFVYSFTEIIIMADALAKGDHELLHKTAHNLYFESAAMIVALITVGKMLEAISKGRTTNALKGLMKLAPKTAVIEVSGELKEVDIDEVQIGDIFAVKPGESIPVDGVIIEGSTSVNEAALTGESIPVDKTVNDRVSAATINQEGFIKARATRVGEDTTLSQIIQMVSDAASTKAQIARIADTVSGYFVPAVLIISLLTLFGWLLAGRTFTFAIARAISVLVISCPCALGLATPVAIMVGNGVGAKNGILFKNAIAQEETGKADVVLLDKTGTITEGKPSVTDVISYMNDEDDFVRLAASLEQKSEHPLARAVVEYAEERKLEHAEISDFKAIPGNGLTAKRNDVSYYAGNRNYISSMIHFTAKADEQIRRLAEEGKTPLLFSDDKNLLGIIAVADTIKPDSAEAIRQLREMGIYTVMLTGDNEITARAIAEKAGVDDVIASVLPEGKEAIVREYQTQGKVLMVGDGINDAPALTRADLGVAIGAGSDIAIDAADVVLMKSNLLDVPAAIRLSKATLRNIHENLFWAFFYNVICIPLAIGLYQVIFGFNWEMNPMLGAAAMSLSSFTVCSNALRLNLLNIYDSSRDRKKTSQIHKITVNDSKEEGSMKKTMIIEGMMCEHCEATVRKALEKIEGVEKAEVSHVEGTAIVTLSREVADEVLKQAVEDRDYEVKEIR